MFLFNTLKHHLPSIVCFIAEAKETHQEDLLAIGNSLMDVYTGRLSASDITKEIAEYLNQNNICKKQEYIAWIQQNSFQKLHISDGSEWILLIGNEEENYVHLHPARYSPHSLRIKATALKTAISFLLENGHEEANTETLNKIRSKIGLSPIKSLSESQHLLSLIALIKGRMS